MGEYAEQYTLETFGVDISAPKKKSAWKWACTICKKNFSSESSRNQHIAMKHKRMSKQ